MSDAPDERVRGEAEENGLVAQIVLLIVASIDHEGLSDAESARVWARLATYALDTAAEEGEPTTNAIEEPTPCFVCDEPGDPARMWLFTYAGYTVVHAHPHHTDDEFAAAAARLTHGHTAPDLIDVFPSRPAPRGGITFTTGDQFASNPRRPGWTERLKSRTRTARYRLACWINPYPEDNEWD